MEVLVGIAGSNTSLGWIGSVFPFGEGDHSPACQVGDIPEHDCEMVVFDQITDVVARHGVTRQIPFPSAEDWMASVNELVEGITAVPPQCCVRSCKGGLCEPFPLFRIQRPAPGPS